MKNEPHTPLTAPPAGFRYIGIRHRIKATKDGDPRPTAVSIQLPDGSLGGYDLASEQDELDWLLGTFPVSWRKVVPGEDLSAFPEWHIQRDAKTDEPLKVPAAYDGFRKGDRVGMVLGGSGDYLAYALAARADSVGATIRRIAPFKLEAARGTAKKDEDAALIARLVSDEPNLFEEAKPLGKSISRLRVSYRLWQDAMKARIAAGNRFCSAFIGQTFLDAGAMALNVSLAKRLTEAKASGPGILALEKEESQKLGRVKKDLAECQIWTDLFEPIPGVGPSIAARIIAGVITITRFGTAPKFRAYCGAHVLDDGSFARRRNDALANWSGEIRQGLYLLGDQFNRRPDTDWGTRLLENKEMYRRKHPHQCLKVKVGQTDDKKPIFEVYALHPDKSRKAKGGWEIDELPEGNRTVSGTLMFTPAHLHKRALWRTITEFVDWLFDAWNAIERGEKAPEPKEWLDRKEHRGIAPLRVAKEKKPKKEKKKTEAEPPTAMAA